MIRQIGWVAVLWCAGFGVSSASAEDLAHRECRRRLEKVASEVRSVVAALQWDRVEGKSRTQYHTECFMHDSMAGVILSVRDRGSRRVLQAFATDGRVMVFKAGADYVRVAPGVSMMADAAAPWVKAREELRKNFPWVPKRTCVPVVSMQVDAGDPAPSLAVGLAAQCLPVGTAARFEWAQPGYWATLKSARLDPELGLVIVEGALFEGAFDQSTGLPVRFSIPKTSTGGSVHASATSPSWSAAEWRKFISDTVSEAPKSLLRVLPSHRALSLGHFEQLVDDVVTRMPVDARVPSATRFLVSELVGPYVLQRGRRSIHSNRDSDLESKRLQLEALECGATMCERALRAGWNRRAAFYLGVVAHDVCTDVMTR